MRNSITHLAKNTLNHAKNLIKAMDAAGFVYDRKDLLDNLVLLKQYHDQKATQKVVEKMEHIIEYIETIENNFEDWQDQKTKATHLFEMSSALHTLLVGVTDAKKHTTRKTILSEWMHRGEIIIFLVLFLIGGELLLFGGTRFGRYAMIWLCLGSLAWFFVKKLVAVR